MNQEQKEYLKKEFGIWLDHISNIYEEKIETSIDQNDRSFLICIEPEGTAKERIKKHVEKYFNLLKGE